MTNKVITSELLLAYSQCPRKAFLLLYSDERGILHEYIRILEERKRENRVKYLRAFQQEHPEACPYEGKLLKGIDFLVESTLRADGLEAYCDILSQVENDSKRRKFSYEPTIIVGSYKISKEQKIELLFIGIVLGKIQKKLPITGRIVNLEGESSKVKLEKL